MVRPTSCLLASCIFATILLVLPSAAYPSQNNYFREETQYDPDEIMDLVARLRNLILLERKMETFKDEAVTGDKRALDLGVGRGFAGGIQAKHLMALAAANYADGPGRRRRDTAH